jgi:hypothetical protein
MNVQALLVAAIGLGALLVAVPSASAEPLPRECTAVTPVLEYDPVGCALKVLDRVPTVCDPDCTTVAAEAINGVLGLTCPYQRILYDDVLGGPFTGMACLQVSG